MCEQIENINKKKLFKQRDTLEIVSIVPKNKNRVSIGDLGRKKKK